MAAIAAPLSHPPGGSGRLVDDLLFGTALATAALLAVVGAARRRADRRAWLVLAAAQLAWAAGELGWALTARRGDPSPVATIGDVGWVASYVLAAAALVALARHRVGRLRPNPILDALTGALAVASVGAAWELGRIAEYQDAAGLALAVNLACPAADLVLAGMVVSISGLAGWRLSRSWLLLGAGYVLLGVTDTAYALAVADGHYREGTPLDAGWLVAALALALACGPTTATGTAATTTAQGDVEGDLDFDVDDQGDAHGIGRRDTTDGEGPIRPGRTRAWLRVAMPTIFTALALTVLVRATSHEMAPAAVGLAAAALVMVGVRLSLTFHQLHALADGQQLARTDELTGLGNRRLLLERLDRALEDRTSQPHLALLIGDLDRFKEVNDTFGHAAGDRLLVDVADRLLTCLGPGDLLSRLGGDEFAVLVPDDSRAGAEDLARRLRAAVAEPHDVNGTSVAVDLSIGIALAPDHAEEPATLLQLADLAMYTAKRQRVGHRVFDVRQVPGPVERMSPAAGLRRAVREGELEVHFQPKVSLARGTPVGLEALVRWRHPDRGLLFPPAFLPQVVDPERVREVTAVVVADALAACARWASTGVSLPVAVNVSAADLEDDELARRLRGELHRHRLAADRVTLEVTETTLMTDPQGARRALVDLRALGVRVALDDYGTGFSSLTHLRDFPLDELKLDRTFVAALTSEPVTWAIVRSTIELAHTLGLTVVAEGVERPADLFALRQLGCDHGQGYLWSAALPPQEVLAWVAGRRLVPRPSAPAGPTLAAPVAPSPAG